MTNAGDSFTGAVSLNNSGANNVALANGGAVVLTASSVGSGTLSVTAVGAISQSGSVVQLAGAGIATFSAGANAITLTDTSNSFTGGVSLNNSGANNVALQSSGALAACCLEYRLGHARGDGDRCDHAERRDRRAGRRRDRDVQCRGANAITLANGSNSFTGAVSLNNSGANNVTFATGGALQLATSNVGYGTLGVTAVGAITQIGAIIEQTGAGTATFNAGANAITLTQQQQQLHGRGVAEQQRAPTTSRS
ncbi:MAG: hypothetical protein WDO24_06760 [Pseudomonadota bacterium]